jgi:hypothetical protein
MNDENTLFALQLSDEAAYALSEALHEIAVACDEHYYAQIRRHLALNEPIQMATGKPWEKNKKTD